MSVQHDYCGAVFPESLFIKKSKKGTPINIIQGTNEIVKMKVR
jgi:hypothetical protein